MYDEPMYRIRCPNANDEPCHYPACTCHSPPRSYPMFNRTTKGDALAAVRDIVRALTYDELKEMATGIGADPDKLNTWAKIGGQAGLDGIAPTVARVHEAV